MKNPLYIKWLVDTGERLKNVDGKEIEIWEFQHQNENNILSEWATHFRNHYCYDSEIDVLVSGTGKTKTQYLLDIKFPDENIKPGPSIRAADFAEILIADFLEFICTYWVPRSRYLDKTIKNESPKGSDVIGFKIKQSEFFSASDEMIIFEVKTALARRNKNLLQIAVQGSALDEIRISESLNSLKQKLVIRKELQQAKTVERFQNILDYPYQEKSGAAVIIDEKYFDKTSLSATITSKHYNSDCLSLIVVKGENMMPLVHDLYRRAAYEA